MTLNFILTIGKSLNSHGLLKAGSAMLVVRAINILSGICLAVVLARGLGVAGYGRYVFILTLVHMLSLPMQMGLPTLLMRQVAIFRGQNDWESLAGIIKWGLLFVSMTFVTIGIAGIAYSFVWLDALSLFQEPLVIYIMGFLLVGMLGFMQVGSAVLRGFERVFLGSLPDSFIRPLTLLLLVFCAQFMIDLSPSLAMGLHALAAFFALLWTAVVVRHHCLTKSPVDLRLASKFQSRTWLSSLLPLSLLAGAAIINSKLDLFMLGLLASEVEVGVYSVGLQIAATAVIGQTIVNSIIGPRIARMYSSGDPQELQRLITHACRLSSFGAICCLAVVVPFGRPLIQLVFGSDFTIAYSVVVIASIGFVFSAMMGPVGLVLNMTGNELTTARVVAVSALFNAVFNAILIPLFGVNGAAIATLVTIVMIQSYLSFRVQGATQLRTDIFTMQLQQVPDRHRSGKI